MSFSTKFSAQFAQRILANIQAVLERDANAALAVIDNTLATFIDYDTPTPIALNFPALYLEPEMTGVKQSEDDSHLMEEHQLLVSVSIVRPNPDTLKTQIVKYVRAIDQVLRTMSNTDLEGSNMPTNAVRKAAWEVTEHRYGLLRANENTIYRKDAQLVLVVQILER